MPSAAYNQWETDRLPKLDEIEAAHSAIGGTARGRRFTTLQINQSYAVMLASQFQGYCRDLHDECVDYFTQAISPTSFQVAVARLLKEGRKLDRGNPNPDNLGSDFNRFDLQFWPSVIASHASARVWQTRLIMLSNWRNAIAHQDFDPLKLHGIRSLKLSDVRKWRGACERLAIRFDRVMRDHLRRVTGTSPW